MRFCLCDCLASGQVVIFYLWVKVQLEEGYGKIQMNGMVWQKESGNKKQRKTKKVKGGKA